MADKKKNFWFEWFSVLFFVFFLASGILLAQEKACQQQASGCQGCAGLKESLNLTPEQEKKIQEFRKKQIKENDAFFDDMVKLRRQMRDLMEEPAKNQAKINDVIDRLAKIRAERQKTALKNRMEFEKIFTPEQLEKMKQMRRPVLGLFPGLRGMLGPEAGFFRPGRFAMSGKWGWKGFGFKRWPGHGCDMCR